MELHEFANEVFQEVLAESDVEGAYREDVFFEQFCEYLTEAGELDSADRSAYLGPIGRGIRVDGYGGDPLIGETSTLSLIICDFHQSRDIGRLVRGEMNMIFKRLSNFLRRSLDPKWRRSLEETSAGFGLADLIAKRWRKIDKVRLILISNRELSERVDGRSGEEFDNRSITYTVWDIGRLYRFVVQKQGREEIEVDFEVNYGGSLPILPARGDDIAHASYLTVIPGKTLANIYDHWGARLLEQNVRVFLQARSKVNKGIKNTIEKEPSRFFAYNNGITATAEAVSIEGRDGQLALRCIRNFQIVNGGQTTASIHAANRSGLDLSSVFVQMKLSVVKPETANALVPKISEYANSQNRVNAADFFSNHPFHVRVESFSRRMWAPAGDGTFRETKWFYERARGQYADAYSAQTASKRKKFMLEYPRGQLFSKTDLAKFYNVWAGRPDRVSLGAQKNFAFFAQEIGRVWEKSSDRFNEMWYREIVAKAIIFRRTEKLVSMQSWYQGGYRANIVAYAIAKMYHDVNGKGCAVNFQKIWQDQALSLVMEEALIDVAEVVHGVLVDPPLGISNVTEWAKKQACWSRVQAIPVAWSEAFLEELFSIDEQRLEAQEGRREQKMLGGIEAQVAVTKEGASFWMDVLEWGRHQKLLTPTEIGVLSLASKIPAKIPSPAQSARVVAALRKLQAEGYSRKLASDE